MWHTKSNATLDHTFSLTAMKFYLCPRKCGNFGERKLLRMNIPLTHLT